MRDFRGKHIWIIGASSGIGAALVHELSMRGALVTASGRNVNALATIAKDANATSLPLDITDADAVRNAAESFSRLDAVIVMAGTYAPSSLYDMKHEDARRIIEVNFAGPLNVITATLPALRRSHGQIALCASVAGYAGLPNGQPYSGTKAALINLTQSLRAEERKNGVDVRLICPGFVHTPMTEKNTFPMPMAITTKEAATHIADGLAGSSFEIHFPKRFTWIMKALACLPYGIYFKIVEKITK